jgi:poly(A) polymerase
MRIESSGWKKPKKEMMEVLTKVEEFLAPHSIEGYLTGGFVRDNLIGHDSYDIDIVVGTDAVELARDVAKALEGTFVPLDKADGIARVVLPEERWGLWGEQKKPLHLDLATPCVGASWRIWHCGTSP